MTEEYVSLEIAKLLKEKGFDACGGYYGFEFGNSVLLPHPYQESICW